MVDDTQAVRRRLGRTLRSLRREAGLTQEQLAERAGYSSGMYVSSIERGQRDLPLSTLSTLAEALGANLADLFVAPSAHEPTGHAERELAPDGLPRSVLLAARDLAAMPEASREQVLDVLRSVIRLARAT